jgi:hypothetical protein
MLLLWQPGAEASVEKNKVSPLRDEDPKNKRRGRNAAPISTA